MDSANSTSAATDSHSNIPIHRSRNSANDEDSAEQDLGREKSIQDLKKAFTRKYRHTVAVHEKSRPSILDHDASTIPGYDGFRNLMVIVLVASNLRLMIENIRKYGILICLTCHEFRHRDIIVGVALYTLVPLCLFNAHLIELAAARQAKILRSAATTSNKSGTSSPTPAQQRLFLATWHTIAWSHAINITLALIVTSYTVFYYIYHPLIGTLVEVHALIVWLKTASYALTNRDLRHAYLHPQTGEREALPEIYIECPYPQNITPGNLCYFWWAPTLVYQPVYPRTDKTRWLFVLKRFGEMVALCLLMWVLSAQYAAPTLRNSLESMATLNIPNILERLLKLSTISLVIWLAGFFALFHSFLNLMAEITQFADRDFYEEWWNSKSLGEYWRTWNKPVYSFFRRHVFSPMTGRGWSPTFASVAVFVVSAFLHELAVGIPTHNIIGVAFVGMLFQVPLIAATMPFQKMQSPTAKAIGNGIFWLSFTIFGQPFAALCYFYAWQAKYGSVGRRWPG